MILGVHHIAVKVADLARAEQFYAGALGLSVLRRWDDEAGRPRSVWLGLDRSDGPSQQASAFLAIELGGPLVGPVRTDEAPGWHCVALGIEAPERENVRERLAGLGYRVERESPYTLYVRDPDGNLVGLSHYPHPRQEVGVTRG